jgi:fluoride ion exporter CrcB/FEX
MTTMSTFINELVLLRGMHGVAAVYTYLLATVCTAQLLVSLLSLWNE